MAEPTILLELQAVGGRPFVLRCRIVPALARCAGKRDDVPHSGTPVSWDGLIRSRR
jgi:hypothetical protein